MEQNKSGLWDDLLRILKEDALRVVIAIIILPIVLYFLGSADISIFGITVHTSGIQIPSIDLNFQFPSFRILDIYALNFRHVIAVLVWCLLVSSFGFIVDNDFDGGGFLFLFFLILALIFMTYSIGFSLILSLIISSSLVIIFSLSITIESCSPLAVVSVPTMLLIFLYWFYEMVSYSWQGIFF